jgi:hypothetical protein
MAHARKLCRPCISRWLIFIQQSLHLVIMAEVVFFPSVYPIHSFIELPFPSVLFAWLIFRCSVHNILQSETAIVVICMVMLKLGVLYKTKSYVIGSSLTSVSKPMTNFQNAALSTCVLALAQPIGFWDQSGWLECFCVLEIVWEVLRSRLIAEKKLMSMGVARSLGSQATTEHF